MRRAGGGTIYPSCPSAISVLIEKTLELFDAARQIRLLMKLKLTFCARPGNRAGRFVEDHGEAVQQFTSP
jgi:hypothetical protein